jgi:hypothetical protein
VVARNVESVRVSESPFATVSSSEITKPGLLHACMQVTWERSAAYGSAIRRSVSLMILLGKAMANRLIDTRVARNVESVRVSESPFATVSSSEITKPGLLHACRCLVHCNPSTTC